MGTGAAGSLYLSFSSLVGGGNCRLSLIYVCNNKSRPEAVEGVSRKSHQRQAVHQPPFSSCHHCRLEPRYVVIVASHYENSAGLSQLHEEDKIATHSRAVRRVEGQPSCCPDCCAIVTITSEVVVPTIQGANHRDTMSFVTGGTT